MVREITDQSCCSGNCILLNPNVSLKQCNAQNFCTGNKFFHKETVSQVTQNLYIFLSIFEKRSVLLITKSLSRNFIYIISPNAVLWFQWYLNFRQQAIAYDKGLSDYMPAQSEVPQGSILGPTLFLLFINDIPLLLKHCNSGLYADDATFHTRSKDMETIEKNTVRFERCYVMG